MLEILSLILNVSVSLLLVMYKPVYMLPIATLLLSMSCVVFRTRKTRVEKAEPIVYFACSIFTIATSFLFSVMNITGELEVKMFNTIIASFLLLYAELTFISRMVVRYNRHRAKHIGLTNALRHKTLKAYVNEWFLTNGRCMLLCTLISYFMNYPLYIGLYVVTINTLFIYCIYFIIAMYGKRFNIKLFGYNIAVSIFEGLYR